MNYKDIARLFTLSILFLLLSCHREKGGEDQALETISVDLNMRNHVYSSELFADIQVIPLETTPESLIRQITQIKYFEERFYIHDYSRSCLLVFDSKGHFLFALNEKGNAPGQYLNLTDFEIDKIHKNIVILCAVSNSLYFYDLEGKFIKNQKLPNIIGAYNSFQFQNEDTIAFFTYDYNSRLKFYSLSEGKIFREEYPEDRKDIFCRGVFPFPNAFRRALIGTVYSLSDACISELYRWDFGDLNNDLAQLDFRPNMNRQEQIQYVRDAYSSKSVNYVIDQQGQNSRYRYAMVVRKDKYLHLFYDRRKNVLLQFEHTQEGLGLFPIYFGEEFMLCTPEGGLPVDELFPEKLRNEEQQRLIQSLSDEENPILIQYDFKK